jgi:hypothetical protein
MGWSVSELDKNKTEQAISNEEIRLDHCKVEREKLFNEFSRIKMLNTQKENEMLDKIEILDRSIKSGEQFVNECKEHLKDFD